MANSVWNPCEETGRCNNWKNEEVIDLLNTIKTNNSMKGSPSGKQLGQLIMPLMGFTRTAFQITGKLKNLRMSYLSCKRRGRTQAARRKCPHYDLLSEIYSEKRISIDATKTMRELNAAQNEIETYIAEKLNVPPGPKLFKISHQLLLETGRSLLINHLKTSANEQKNILIDHLKFFMESKECVSMDKNKVMQELARITKLMRNYNSNQANCWMGIQIDMNPDKVRKWGSRETENVLDILRASMRKGYDCSLSQGQGKQRESINRYFQAEQAASSASDDSSKDVSLSEDDEGSIKEEKKCSNKESDSPVGRTKHSRSRAWSNVETSVMLSLLQDLNLTHHIAHRLSLEVVRVIVEPLRQRGYARSPMQIQIKLRNLRKSYYQCLRAGCTEIAIARCPHFHKLNEIYNKSHEDTTLPGGGDILESFSGHSSCNSGLAEPNARSAGLGGTSDVDAESGKMRMPLETMCGEDSTVAADNEKQPGPARDSANGSSFEKKLRIGNYDITEEANGSNDPEDSDDESVEERMGEDTREIPSRIEVAEKPKGIPSQKSPYRANVSTTRLRKHRLQKNIGNAYSPRTKKDSSTLRTMRIVMAQLLGHEKLLQRQHHSWMERQFEIHRKHDRDHRELLINELREFRKSFNSAVSKPSTASNQRID